MYTEPPPLLFSHCHASFLQRCHGTCPALPMPSSPQRGERRLSPLSLFSSLLSRPSYFSLPRTCSHPPSLKESLEKREGRREGRREEREKRRGETSERETEMPLLSASDAPNLEDLGEGRATGMVTCRHIVWHMHIGTGIREDICYIHIYMA